MKTYRKNELRKKTEIIKATILCSFIGTVLLFKVGTSLGAFLYHMAH